MERVIDEKVEDWENYSRQLLVDGYEPAKFEKALIYIGKAEIDEALKLKLIWSDNHFPDN